MSDKVEAVKVVCQKCGQRAELYVSTKGLVCLCCLETMDE